MRDCFSLDVWEDCGKGSGQDDVSLQSVCGQVNFSKNIKLFIGLDLVRKLRAIIYCNGSSGPNSEPKGLGIRSEMPEQQL